MPVSATGANDDNVIFQESQAEVARLQLQHKVLKSYMKSLVYAPVDLTRPGLRILDQATADGLWLRDLKSTVTAQHEYVGTDIADIYFPSDPPSDMSFHHQSMTEPWPASWQKTFDLVHSRFALPGVGMIPTEQVVSNLAGLVKPGGYLQLVEINDEESASLNPALKAFGQVFQDMLTLVTAGKGMHLRRDCRGFMEAAGLTEIETLDFDVPVGANAETAEIQAASVESVVSTATGLTMLLKSMPPMTFSIAELDALPGQLEQELKTLGGVLPVFVTWGRQP